MGACALVLWGPGGKNGVWVLRKDAAMADKDKDKDNDNDRDRHKDKDDDVKRIKQLIEIMKENGLVEIEIKHDDDKIVLKRAQPQQVFGGTPVMMPESGTVSAGAGGTRASDQPVAPPREDLVEIKSPIVGTFYATPSPDSEPYVEVGSTVTAHTVVCIIEAMKVMNEIKAEVEGTVVEVLVSNGQAVEYGQVLFRVRPD
jgi:acetyl-CoA carboxylase biotin carboxyl carrier protein